MGAPDPRQLHRVHDGADRRTGRRRKHRLARVSGRATGGAAHRQPAAPRPAGAAHRRRAAGVPLRPGRGGTLLLLRGRYGRSRAGRLLQQLQRSQLRAGQLHGVVERQARFPDQLELRPGRARAAGGGRGRAGDAPERRPRAARAGAPGRRHGQGGVGNDQRSHGERLQQPDQVGPLHDRDDRERAAVPVVPQPAHPGSRLHHGPRGGHLASGVGGRRIRQRARGPRGPALSAQPALYDRLRREPGVRAQPGSPKHDVARGPSHGPAPGNARRHRPRLRCAGAHADQHGAGDGREQQLRRSEEPGLLRPGAARLEEPPLRDRRSPRRRPLRLRARLRPAPLPQGVRIVDPLRGARARALARRGTRDEPQAPHGLRPRRPRAGSVRGNAGLHGGPRSGTTASAPSGGKRSSSASTPVSSRTAWAWSSRTTTAA